MICGIYEIRNTVTGRVYTGSTIDFEQRCVDHRANLCIGRHGNRLLQADWLQYGATVFAFALLEEVEYCPQSNILLVYAEQRHIEAAKAQAAGVYNIRPARRSPHDLWDDDEDSQSKRQHAIDRQTALG